MCGPTHILSPNVKVEASFIMICVYKFYQSKAYGDYLSNEICE